MAKKGRGKKGKQRDDDDDDYEPKGRAANRRVVAASMAKAELQLVRPQSAPPAALVGAAAAAASRPGSVMAVTVEDKDCGSRLDAVLAKKLVLVPPLTRARVQRALKAGCVKVNGKVVTKTSLKMRLDDVIHWDDASATERAAEVNGLGMVEPEQLDFGIYSEDDHMILLEKPAGMTVHPAGAVRTGTLVNALLHHAGCAAILQGTQTAEAEPDASEAGAAERPQLSVGGGLFVGDLVDVQTADGFEEGARVVGPSESGDLGEVRLEFADGIIDDWDISQLSVKRKVEANLNRASSSGRHTAAAAAVHTKPGEVVQIESGAELKGLLTSPETVIVDFGATWCGICKTIESAFTSLARANPDVVFANVDVDVCEELDVEKFDVEVMPTFQAFVGGQKVGELLGADKRQLEGFVKKHTPGGSKQPSSEPEPEPELDVSALTRAQAASGAARSERLEKVSAILDSAAAAGSAANDSARLKQLSKGGAMSTSERAGGVVRPGIVHRLDRGTSGVMVVAKNEAAHAHLSSQFENRSTRRLYLAIVWGVPVPAQGRIETHVGRDPNDRLRQAVLPPGQGARYAATNYKLMATLDDGNASVLRFALETGRTHQIRVHAKHLGHPLIGDATYNGTRIMCGPQNKQRQRLYNDIFENVLPRPALHAASLALEHPVTEAWVMTRSALPTDMARVIEMLGGNAAAIDQQLMSGDPHEKQTNVASSWFDETGGVVLQKD